MSDNITLPNGQIMRSHNVSGVQWPVSALGTSDGSDCSDTNPAPAAPGTKPITALNAVTTNGNSGILSLGRARSNLAMQVAVSGFTGGTVTLYGAIDGTNADTGTALATFTIGTDASNTIKYATGKPVTGIYVVFASSVGSGTVTATVAAC